MNVLYTVDSLLFGLVSTSVYLSWLSRDILANQIFEVMYLAKKD